VHAAGNVISLKLIVEDEDIVQKINNHLGPQIRIWGYERTINSFSAYQLVDSRIYEYLIPTHSFLPPHPSSYLGRKIAVLAEENDDAEAWKSRQEEVQGFWENVDSTLITPILESYDTDTRAVLERALFLREDAASALEPTKNIDYKGSEAETEPTQPNDTTDLPLGERAREDYQRTVENVVERIQKENPRDDQIKAMLQDHDDDMRAVLEMALTLREQDPFKSAASLASEAQKQWTHKHKKMSPITEGIRKLRATYVAAKRSYRISPARLDRVRKCLAMYEGTRNYHNFTVDKAFRDPSAKRVIRSFVVNPEPILINGTEWLSLKVHGQSFMMHQIRKMVGMVALVVRCGCDPIRIMEAYGEDTISIPKAPSLGLLLERPVFDSYNKRAQSEHGKEALDFGKYEKEMEEFKQREIYERIYQDEEKNNMSVSVFFWHARNHTMELIFLDRFGNFFNHVDNFASEAFLFLTSGGIAATKRAGAQHGDKGISMDPALESEPETEVLRTGEGDEG
jgi:tRNA pseudouridine38-40 synthase